MTAEHPMRSSEPSCWALLIGINHYRSPSVPRLRGCANDVQALNTFLINQLRTPPAQIRQLIDGDATRAAILNAFQTFLIDNPAIRHGDQIVFHYSGHGARMRCPPGWSASGYIEALVPHDGRMEGVYDIPDLTLQALLHRLAAAKGDHITVMLDCCHSGSGTRDIHVPGATYVRWLPDDERIPPADLDAQIRAWGRAHTVGPSGWRSQSMPYVLLASCRDREVSNEHPVDTGVQPEIWHGSLTYFTLQALRDVGKMPMRISYLELHERVAAQVNATYTRQMPQCEGDGRTRAVFGDLRIEHDPFFTVDDVQIDSVRLDGGLVHGLQQGMVLALYPPSVRTRDRLPAEPICLVTVTEVSVTRALARALAPADRTIPLHARGVIIQYVYTSQRQAVALLARGGGLEQDTLAWLRGLIVGSAHGSTPSPYLTLADSPARGFDLRVVAQDGALRIYGADDTLLVEPEPLAARHRVLAALESIARYRTLLALRNQQPGSKLVGKIKLRLRRYRDTPAGPAAEPLAAHGPGNELTLLYDPLHPEHNLYVVDVINESTLPVYAHVFILNPDFSIERLYPNQGQESAISPARDGKAGILSIGLPPSGSRPLEIYLPNQPPWESCRDYLKVIVTKTEMSTDLRMLEQPALAVSAPERGISGRSALDQLLRAVMAGMRHPYKIKDLEDNDWATSELPFTVVRAAQTVALRGAARNIPVADQLMLDAPVGLLRAFLRCTTLSIFFTMSVVCFSG